MIGVVIPVHNSEKTLDRCVRSVVAQSYRDIVIVLVENGSTDASYARCVEWAKSDSRIVVLQSEKGVSAARNKGIEYLQTIGVDYFGFVDSDDYIAPRMYQRLVDACMTAGAELAICQYYIVKGDTVEKSQEDLTAVVQKKDISVFFDRHAKVMGAVWKCLFAARFLNLRFDTEIKIAEDLMFLLWAVKGADKIAAVDEPLYYYEAPQSALYYKHGADFAVQNAKSILHNMIALFGDETHNTIKSEKYILYMQIVRMAIYRRDDYLKALSKLQKDEFCNTLKSKDNFVEAMKRLSDASDKILAVLVYFKQWRILNAIINRKR